MPNRETIVNHNLKKLVDDLFREGGEALYLPAPEGQEGGYTYFLEKEEVVVIQCLGPPDCNWDSRTQRVTKRGVTGGRKKRQSCDAGDNRDDYMHVTERTVSRTHFRIFQDDGRFVLQDEGSASGTYVRLPYGTPLPLFPGIILLIGKHQLIVRDLDEDLSEGIHVLDLNKSGEEVDFLEFHSVISF